MGLEFAIFAVSLLAAGAMRPWRLLRPGPEGVALATPLLATLVVLPWLWALPSLHAMPLQLQWSGACLVLLMLGWPLAVPVFALVAALAGQIASLPFSDQLALAVWQGVVPATLATLLGALLRRLFGTHLFVYTLGRGFLGTVLCLFLAGTLAREAGHGLPGVSSALDGVARWLMAWGDGVVTGMLTAVFVAFRPHWLATWSDTLYLRKPPPQP